MRSRRRAAVALAAVLLWPAEASATTFYIDPDGGSDGNSGTSAATPWADFTPVNARSLAPGDELLLKAGATQKQMLSPHGSGTAASPIRVSTYGGTARARLDRTGGGSGFAGIALIGGPSYWTFEHLEISNWGPGNAGVYLEGVSHLTFRDLYVHHVDNGILASSPSEVSYVTVSESRIAELPRDRASVAINLTENSHHWLVQSTTLANAGDSCVLDVGHDNVYDGLEVHDCGFVTARFYGAHGLYLRGPALTLRNSHVWDTATNCVSVRSQFAVVENNRLHGCPIGVGYFHYASVPDRPVRIARNRIWDVGSAGIYVDSGSPMRFVITNNTIVSAHDGIVVRGGTSLALENTIVTGSATQVLVVTGVPISGIVERANILWTRAAAATPFAWPGGAGTFAAWRAATGQGAGSLSVDPLLDSEIDSLTPAIGSPAIDAGVASTAAMQLNPGCAGAIDQYCGAAPDIGAVETAVVSAPPPPPLPPPPVADARAPSVPPAFAAVAIAVTSVTLRWGASGDDVGVAGYEVRRNGGLVATVKELSLTVRDLTGGMTYTFTVRAFDAAGNRSPSAMVIIRTRTDAASRRAAMAALRKRDKTAPLAPTNLTLTRRGLTSVTLAWKAPRARDVASYRLVREDSNLVLVRTKRTRANARGLAAGRAYRFYVVAVDRAGNVSKRSALLKVTLQR